MANDDTMSASPPTEATQDPDADPERPSSTARVAIDSRDSGEEEEEEEGADDFLPGADAASRLKALTAGVRDQDDLERELAQQVRS